MDQMIIAEKLESLRRCVQRIEDKTPKDAGSLIRDIDLQDILVVNLTRAVQISADMAVISLVRPISRCRKRWVMFLLSCKNSMRFHKKPMND